MTVEEEASRWFSDAKGATRTLKYFIPVEQLGKGGFGSVYKAINPSNNHVVAVKLLSEDIDPNDKKGIKKREKALRKEYKLFSKFHHPNIIPIYDIGRAEGKLYIVMEFADNKDLDQRLADKERPLTVKEKLAITKQIVAGMTYIADKKLIHGDIKPANILLFTNGRVKLTDFGLSRRKGWASESVAKGTAFYMAPEQVLKLGMGEYSDIYSLGVMMYEMFAGVRPFPVPQQSRNGDGNVRFGLRAKIDKRAILKQHVTSEPIPPSTINPQISRPLEKTIMRCLEKKPARRYRRLRFVWSALINCPEFGAGRI